MIVHYTSTKKKFLEIKTLQFPVEMLAETFVASISTADHSRTALTTVPIVKDAAIFSFTLHPQFTQTGVFKKSSTAPNGVAVSDSHLFAAQSNKAVIHVYSKERGSHEATIPFPEKITAVVTAAEAGEILIMGTETGRLLLWEVIQAHLEHPVSSF